MEKGNLRVDINVSIRKKGASKLGTRREVKNLNSFKSVQKAIEYEYLKQIEILETGDKVEQSTLTWDEKNNKTKIIRKKEDAHDYRYFPEPDLPHLHISQEQIDEAHKTLPELPDQKFERFLDSYKIKEQDLKKLISDIDLADYFESILKITNLHQETANWILVELLAYINKHNISINNFPIDKKRIADLIILFSNGKLTNINMKKIFSIMLSDKRTATEIMNEESLMVITDDNFLEDLIKGVFSKNEAEFRRLKNGENKLIGFFMGQIMREAKGKGDPKTIQKIINKHIANN